MEKKTIKFSSMEVIKELRKHRYAGIMGMVNRVELSGWLGQREKWYVKFFPSVAVIPYFRAPH